MTGTEGDIPAPGGSFSGAWTPPAWAPLPAQETPPRARAPRWRFVVAWAGLVVILAAVAVWVMRDETSYPDKWDPRITDLVSFVEDERGLDFKHPVYVDFLSEAEFKKLVQADESELTDDDRQSVTDAVGFLRAIGLAEGDLDFFDAMNQLNTETVLAFYAFDDERIRIRGRKLDLATRVTVVHELTHALQDQHFDLSVLQDPDDTSSSALRVLVEGDAGAVEDAYVGELTESENEEYYKAVEQLGADIDLEGVPAALQLIEGAPYRFGPVLVAVLRADGGQAALDDAFRDPPQVEEHFFDPVTFVDGDEPDPVAQPPLPEGATLLDDGEFGALGWYVMLSERIDAHAALAAVDGWGGDAYVAYREDDRVCVDVRYRGETESDTDEMQSALVTWQSRLAGGKVRVEADGDALKLHACDPGPGARLTTDNSLDAIALPAVRADILAVFVDESTGLTLDEARCVADRVVNEATVEQLIDPEGTAYLDEFEQRLVGYARSCAG